MIVFKFGGASVKNAEAVRNVGEIINKHKNNLVVVVSAMGKTTNLLEDLAKAYYKQNNSRWDLFSEFKSFHTKITDELFKDIELPYEISEIYSTLEKKLNDIPNGDFNFEYDQIVCFGELLSTMIISLYLNNTGTLNQWIDIRSCLLTDSKYREANIDWSISSERIKNKFNFKSENIYFTQGFIGADHKNNTTTLGREGSDFTGAILGNILNADYVAIWKDVEGVLNADPKQMEATLKLDELSYREAIEMSHSGAKIIHPKTIKPLQNKNIPLFVKSFINPDSEGTIIHPVNKTLKLEPVYIIKENQVLITLSPNDFSFIGVDDIALVFDILSKNRLKVNLFQQSAIDLNLVIDTPESIIEETIKQLRTKYEVKYNTGLELATIRYYNDDSVKEFIKERKVFIEQKSRRTARIVLI